MNRRLSGTETLRLAIHGLKAHPLRTTLNLLGIAIGVTAAILLSAVVSGTSQVVKAEVQGLGSNVIVVYPRSASSSGLQASFPTATTLTSDDVKAISAEAPDAVAAVPTAGAHTDVASLDRVYKSDVVGTTDNFPAVRGYQVSSGAYFSGADVQAAASVAVVGQTVVDNLFGGADPVGRTIKVNQHPYRVIGLFRPRGSYGSLNLDDVVVVPITAAWRYLLPQTDPRIQQVYVAARSPKVTPAAAYEVYQVLLHRHHILSPDQADFQVRSAADILGSAARLSSAVSWLLGAIAFISLLVGGIGIANVMLVTVTERRREIGMRRAVGARKEDIRSQFLTQAILLGAAGGMVGIVIGLLLAVEAPTILRDLPPPIVSWVWVGAAAVISIAIGAVAGIYPAARAAALQPVEALRDS